MERSKSKRQAGFSLVELLIVVIVVLIVAAVAVPNMINAAHIARLRAAGSDFSSLAQTARIRAVQDDRYYSVRVFAGPPEVAFADIYPQTNNGASGNGGASVDSRDPVNPISGEVTPQAVANAPQTANLSGQFLPAGSLLVPKDGSATATPITFGPRGLPCATQAATGGTICDSGGGPTAYWIFFKNNTTSAWEAVTVSPAGRIRKWIYAGTANAGGWGAI
jgi:prepilin-type N-terminal cleavage/methylation domain-containing protein